MKRILIWLLPLVLLACGQSKDNREPAAELKPFQAKLQLEVLWSENLGASGRIGEQYLKVHVAKDIVYAAAADGDIQALALDTGKRLWQSSLDESLSAGISGYANRLFVATPRGEVIALSTTDGKIIWRKQLGTEILVPPVAASGRVIVRSADGRIHALSSKDGKRIWTHAEEVPALSLRGESSPVIDRNAVFVGLNNGRFVALDLKRGKVFWRKTIAVPSGRSDVERMVDIDGDPLLVGGVIMVSSFQGRVVKLSAKDGRIRWSRKMSSNRDVMADRKRVYISDEFSVLWALDAGSGSALWKQEDVRMRGLSAAAPYQKYVVAGDYQGYAHFFSVSNGSVVARQQVDDTPIRATPQVIGDKVLLQTMGGTLQVLRAKPLK